MGERGLSRLDVGGRMRSRGNVDACARAAPALAPWRGLTASSAVRMSLKLRCAVRKLIGSRTYSEESALSSE